MKKHGFVFRIAAILASLVLILSLAGCVKDYSDWLSSVAEQAGIETLVPADPTKEPARPTRPPETQPSSSDATEEPSSAAPLPPVSGDLIPEYREITKEEFEALCKELTEAASGNDFSKIKELYDKLYQEYEQICDNYTLSYLAYCRKVSDDDLSQKYQDLEALAYDLGDLACQAFRAVTQGPCARDFKSYVDDVAFDYFAEYEDMTDQEKEWQKRETELVTKYNKIIDEHSDEIYVEDEKINKLVGPIYLELVALRTEMAKHYGYDNYADYADENVFNRDYDGKAAEAFHAAVKEIAPEYFDALYFTDAYFGMMNVKDKMKTDEMIAKLGELAQKISPLAEQYQKVLADHQLYDISSASGRLDAGYTTSFDTTDCAYIFMTTSDNARDFMTLTHEFGHFINMNLVINPNTFAFGSSMDLNEIHSNGFEALCTKYYSEVFGTNADKALSACLIELLMNVVDGCIYDEFQRRVYENPGMSLDDINDMFESLSWEYGNYYQSKYIWQYVNHNFESPMYYLSYAASGIVALQIWSVSQKDYPKAVRMWEDIEKAGPYDFGYFELLDNLDIRTFDDKANVVQICMDALNRIHELNP